MRLCFSCAIFCVVVAVAAAVRDSLNFVLPAGRRECYFEDFTAELPVRTIEAFIQSVGNVDVQLSIHGPLSLDDIRKGAFEKPIVSEKIDSTKEEESDTLTFVMEFKPVSAGTYAICLDNRKSHFLQKIVQLDVRLPSKTTPIVLKVNTHSADGSSAGAAAENDPAAQEMAAAQEAIARIHANLLKIQTSQLRDRHRLSLHSEVNKASHSEVLQGSIVETACFILASLFQLLFVRRWFAGRASSSAGLRA